MKKKSRRHWRPGCVTPLEVRTLLAASLPTATWIGQDGHDLVGRSSASGPDGVQDIDIAVAGLPTNVSVVKADITGYGGGEWEYQRSRRTDPGPLRWCRRRARPRAVSLRGALPGRDGALLLYHVHVQRPVDRDHRVHGRDRKPGPENARARRELAVAGTGWPRLDQSRPRGRPRWVSGRRHRPDAALGHRANPVGHPDFLGRRSPGRSAPTPICSPMPS